MAYDKFINEVTPPRKNARGKKTRNPGWQPGNHWVQCDICASVIRSQDAMFTWDNRIVCPDDWEPRHPQDFVRARYDDIRAKEPVRPESVDIDVDGNVLIGGSGDPVDNADSGGGGSVTDAILNTDLSSEIPIDNRLIDLPGFEGEHFDIIVKRDGTLIINRVPGENDIYDWTIPTGTGAGDPFETSIGSIGGVQMTFTQPDGNQIIGTGGLTDFFDNDEDRVWRVDPIISTATQTLIQFQFRRKTDPLVDRMFITKRLQFF